MTDHDIQQNPEAQSATAASRRKRRLRRWATGMMIALTLYAAAGFLLAPHLVQRYVPQFASEQLQREAEIGEVRINPFLLTFDARDFAFREADGRPILALSRLFVDLEVKSLFRWAWTLAEIRLEAPDLHLVLGDDARLNLARLADAFPAETSPEPADEPGPPPRLVLEKVVLQQGTLTFTDETVPETARLVATPLNLELRDISTLPERRGPYGLRARLPGGGEVTWEGELALNPIASNGTLRVADLQLAGIWPLLHAPPHLAEPGGEIDLDLTYRLAYEEGETWALHLDALSLEGSDLGFQDTLRATPIAFGIGLARFGLRAGARFGGLDPELEIDGIEATLQEVTGVETGGDPLLRLESVELDEGLLNLAERSIAIPRLAVRGGRVSGAVDADGTLNWTAPPPGSQADAGSAQGDAENGTPWAVDLASVTVDGVGIDFSDASRVTPMELAVGSTGIALRVHAELGGGTPRLLAEEIAIELGEVALAEQDGAPVLDIETISLGGGRLDLEARHIDVARIHLERGATRLNREADGTVREMAALSTRDRGKLRRELASALASAEAEGDPWRYAIDEVAFAEFAVSYADAVSDPVVAFDFDAIDLRLTDLSNDGATPLRYDGRLRVRQGGGARVTGSVTQSGETANAEIELEQLALAPLAPLLARIAALELDSGTLSSKVMLDYAASGKGPRLQAKGDLSLRDLLVREKISGDRFLAWKALEADGVALQLGPDALAVSEIRLSGPGAKIVVFEDRTVNLVRVFTDQENAAAPSTEPPPDTDEAAFPVSVKRIRVDDGEVDFADLSLVLPFATRIEALGGDITGLAPGPQARATLALEGQVGEYGQATVNGSLAPFAPKAFADVTVAFSNVEMSPLSAYTATFAGRKIASGKLDLNLEYKLEQSELLGDNTIALREFTLGERIESPDAADLPLDLAVALLSDSSGKIEAVLPVRGNVDHPEFSYGGLVGQAIANLIAKIVTAPFRALGAALGHEASDHDTVLFNAGHSSIAPPEREKLARVAEALAARPQLALTITGAYDPAVDGPALGKRDLALALAAALDEAVATGDDPPPPDFAGAATQLALEKLAVERAGKAAVDAFATSHGKEAGRAVERVNPVAGRLGRASTDAAFYAALFDHLVKLAPQPEDRLVELGQQRTAAIAEVLAGQSALDAARLTRAKPAKTEAQENAVPVALELGVHGSG